MGGARHWLESLYTSWPATLLEGFRAGLEARKRDPPRILLGCGMGGSAYSIAAASLALEEHGYSVIAWRGHKPLRLPGAGVLAVSYSGETLETIECTRASIEAGLPALGVAGRGSTLERLLEARGMPVAGLERRGVPRASLGSLVGAIMGLVAGGVAARRLSRVASSLDVDGLSAEAEKVAYFLWEALEAEALPVVVACDPQGLLTSRWLSELAENAGVRVVAEAYPGAGHNSIVTWDYPGGRGYFLFIKRAPPGDGFCRAVEGFIEERYRELGPLHVVDLSRYEVADPLAAALANAIVAGLASTRLALRLGRDPLETRGIDLYKSKLHGILKAP